jgi:hypothetical protein
VILVRNNENDNSHLYEASPSQAKKEISLNKFSPNRSIRSSVNQSAKRTEKANSGSSRKPLSSRYDSNQKMTESNEHVIVSINDMMDDRTVTLSSIPAENSKHSALLDALTHNMDSYDDNIWQLGEPFSRQVYRSDKEEQKDCIEILEINNSPGSPTHDSNMPKTPVKASQSDTKVTKMRQLNFDMSDFEPNENHQPRRRNRMEQKNEINEPDYCLSAGK